MKTGVTILRMLVIATLIGSLLAACGSSESSPTQTTASSQPTSTTSTQTEPTTATDPAATSADAQPTATQPAKATVAPTSTPAATPTTPPTATQEPTATSEPTAEQEPTATQQADQPAPPSGDLEAMLLTVDDLDEGWEPVSNDEAPITGDEGYCGNTGWFDIAADVPMAQAVFLVTTFGPFLGEGIHKFESEEQATAAMDHWRQHMTCDTWIDPESGSEGTSTALDVTATGDEVVARHYSLGALGLFIETDTVLVRIKQYVVQIVMTAFGETSTSQTQEIVNRAIKKIR